jgi:ABC-type uncharacterized transport system substrate-binding protein
MRASSDSIQWTRHIVAALLLTFAISEQPACAQATYPQQIAVMKILNPNVKTIGALGGGLTEKAIQALARAGLGQGIQVVVAIPRNASEIATLYKTLVKTKKADMIWLPDPDDGLMLGVGFEFLKSNTVLDKTGLCVPTAALVASGGLCSVQVEDGKLVVYVNQRIAGVIGAGVPKEARDDVSFVSR